MKPRSAKPRPAERCSSGIRWYGFFDTIHGGAVGSSTNSTQDTPSTVANRFMNRTHWRCVVAHSTAITMTGEMKWVM